MLPVRFESSPHRSGRSAGRYALIALIVGALAVEPAAAQAPAGPAEQPELSAQSGPKKHRKRQQRPIQMGTSGGNVNDFTIDPPFIFCCSGTLGSLVRKGNQLFILSNNHVIAMGNQARPGDDINQPGMLDNRCETPVGDFIGQLSGFKKLKLNRGKNHVDAAIAAAIEGLVDGTGEIIGIGVPGNTTASPQVGMAVKKGGRTTGVRTGLVDAINVTVDVQYGRDCSQDPIIDVGRFVKQVIIVSNTRKPFSAGGDSGSLVVENVKNCPRPVGLLFAGGGGVTVANKMSTVLAQVKKMKPKGPAQLVGCTPSMTAGAELESQRGIPELGERQLRLARRIQARADADMLEIEGVHAMGIGRSSSQPDAPVFKVYVDGAGAGLDPRIPRDIEGIPVEVVESGPIRALNCRRADPVDPSAGL